MPDVIIRPGKAETVQTALSDPEADRPFFRAKLMEFIKAQGFTPEEKAALARDFLAGKQTADCDIGKLHDLYLWTSEADQVKRWRADKGAG